MDFVLHHHDSYDEAFPEDLPCVSHWTTDSEDDSSPGVEAQNTCDFPESTRRLSFDSSMTATRIHTNEQQQHQHRAHSPPNRKRSRRIHRQNTMPPTFEQISEDEEIQAGYNESTGGSCSDDESMYSSRSKSVDRSPHSRPGEMMLQRALAHQSPKRTPPPPLNIMLAHHRNGLNHKPNHYRSCDSLINSAKLLMLPVIPEATTPSSPINLDDQRQQRLQQQQQQQQQQQTTPTKSKAADNNNETDHWLPRTLPRTFST